jgi:hypothetical protein
LNKSRATARASVKSGGLAGSKGIASSAIRIKGMIVVTINVLNVDFTVICTQENVNRFQSGIVLPCIVGLD